MLVQREMCVWMWGEKQRTLPALALWRKVIYVLCQEPAWEWILPTSPNETSLPIPLTILPGFPWVITSKSFPVLPTMLSAQLCLPSCCPMPRLPSFLLSPSSSANPHNSLMLPWQHFAAAHVSLSLLLLISLSPLSLPFWHPQLHPSLSLILLWDVRLKGLQSVWVCSPDSADAGKTGDWGERRQGSVRGQIHCSISHQPRKSWKD